jgi:hypothetical protein
MCNRGLLYIMQVVWGTFKNKPLKTGLQLLCTAMFYALPAFTEVGRHAYIVVETTEFPIIIDKVERDMSYEFDKRFDCCDKDEWRDCDKEHKDCEYLGKKVTECKYFRVCECKFHEPEKKKEPCCPCCQKCQRCGKFHN